MSEPSRLSISELPPSTVIEVADIIELAAFEDEVALDIDRRLAEAIPTLNTHLDIERWSGRVALRELLRPPKFNGPIVDIKLRVMDDPHSQLKNAVKEGWSIGGRGRITSTEIGLPFWQGFDLVANARSSGRGVIGQIQSKLWYYPVSLYEWAPGRFSTSHAGYLSETVHRAVAKPHLEEERFVELYETSKRTATTLQLKTLLRNRRSIG